MVARNRFLAESMLNNGNGSSQKIPKSPKPKYSVPTCHSTLKQLEQARLAKEFELQRRKSLQHTSTGSPKSISRDFYNNNNNNNNYSDEQKTRETNIPFPYEKTRETNSIPYEEIKIKRSLSRATSVGKLVNNFENNSISRNFPTKEENNIGAANGYDADDDETETDANPEVLNFGGKIQMMKPVIAIKPPLATKPFLRHTVSCRPGQKTREINFMSFWSCCCFGSCYMS